MKKIFALLISFTVLSLSFANQSTQKEEDIKITHGPYLQEVDATGATVVWTTNKPAVSWVEIAPDDNKHFYAEERMKFFNSPLGKKKISKLHKIRIGDLSADTIYKYRIFSTQVTKTGHDNFTLYGRTASSQVYKVEPLSFKTLGDSIGDVTFSMVCDIHGDSVRLAKLLEYTPESANFILLNGDMVSSMENEEQIFKGFMDTLVEKTKSSLPIYYARGNHESRGAFSEEFMNYFPTPTGKPYYTVKCGGVYFVFLDGGEDKPDSDIEYYSTADYDKYRSEQAQWLKSIANSDDFKKAKARIVVTHIPPSWGSWHGSIDFRKKFVQILNDANIDVILSGHEHRQTFYPPSKDGGFNAPNIVNSNLDLMNVIVGEDDIRISFCDVDGKESREPIVLKLKK